MERSRRCGDAFVELLEVMRRLRSEEGCPWDRKQTMESLRPYVVEEAYELVDAIDRGDPEGVREECGDLLLQVVFLAQIASEEGLFDALDVVEGIRLKLIRRHPHVFGDLEVSSAEEVSRNWNRLKLSERGNEGGGFLDSIPRALPALMASTLLQDRAAKVGFDWERAEDALSKLKEEVQELSESLEAGGERALLEEEIGDIIFAAVNVARLLGLDAETALRRTNDKFRRRFAYIERALAERNKSLESSSLEEMDRLWNEAKAKGV